MAEYYARHRAEEMGLDIRIDSAGTHYYVSGIADNSLLLLQEDGIKVNNHSPKIIDHDLLHSFDLVLCMDTTHKNKINIDYPEYKDKVFLLSEFATGKREDIVDPVGMGLAAYREIFETIKRFVDSVLKKI